MNDYIKTVWQDLPDTSTPITADRLNNIEDGIEYLFEHGVGGGDTLPIGIILPFSDDTIPEGYMLCDGAAISRTTYSTLFGIIGTTYGEGDGSTTFNLPNLKGRVPVGRDITDTDFDTLGETGGEKEHMHYNGMSAYNNQLTVSNTNSDSSHSADELYTITGTNGFNGVGTQNVYAYSTESGSSLQPYQVVNYIIKVSQTTSTQAQVIDGYSASTTDSYSCNYVNGSVGKILWTNSSPNSNFEGQTITLSSADYDFYEIYCTYNCTTASQYANGFRTIKGKGLIISENGYGTDLSIRRKIDYTDATHLLISPAYGGVNIDNGYLVPIYVIGYKTGTFN